jgi:hypothetical protein
MEVWKDIIGYEGTYKISSNGRVMSLKRPKVKKDKVLESYLSSEGYYTVKLTKDGKCKSHKVHKLVAINFLNHTPCGYIEVVDHKDNNKHNNSVDNLQLITQRENVSKSRKNNHSVLTGVSFSKELKRFYATIKILGKTVYLGFFNCETRAHLSYVKAVKNIDNFVNPTQFRQLINNQIHN